MYRLAFITTLTLVGLVGRGQAEEITFEKHIRPILRAACFHCHGEEEKPKAKLDLRLPSLMIKGGVSGPAIVPGQLDKSHLWEQISTDEMPEGSKKLTPEQKELIKRWIISGAKTARPEPKNPDDLRITEEDRDFWAFRPITKPNVPAIPAPSAIDAFILAELKAKNIAPNPIADKRTLIRRATFDLIGLPPTPDEVKAFLEDQSANSYEKLLDRLLASPHYGEQWARHWLDAAGYAESDGVTTDDKQRPHAWRYRDYVIKAMNQDKPFDQFLTEQLAGDEMVTRRPLTNLTPDEIEKLTATGYLRMAPDATNTDNSVLERNNAVAETVKVFGASILGLTVGCAQCHDHRYDPISITDYYKLRAVFDPAFNLKTWQKPVTRVINITTPEVQKQRDEIEAKAKLMDEAIKADDRKFEDAVFEKEILKIPEAEREAIRKAFFAEKKTPEQQAHLNKYTNLKIRGTLILFDPKNYNEQKKRRAEVAKLRATKPDEAFIAYTSDIPGAVAESMVYFRGDHESPKAKVTPSELAILAINRPSSDVPLKQTNLPTTGRRLAYAKMLTDGKHPLTARVAVNRMWMHHFGRGIVATPGDFGAFGERPSHPALLDWLASDFMANGWKQKRLHKMIMMTEAYQRTSVRTPEMQKIDPENRLLARSSVRRLSAEQLRDAMITVSGKLKPTIGGPSVPVAEDLIGMPILGKQIYNEGLLQKVDSVGDDEFRRTIYIEVRRKWPLPMLDAFDLPVMKPNCDSRRCTTVAPQSLLFMNNEFVIKMAGLIGEAILKHPGQTEDRINQTFAVLFGQSPTNQERATCMNFLTRQTAAFKVQGTQTKNKSLTDFAENHAFISLCQVLIGSNKFLYID